jgi:ArsR family transcriptional regulator, arsenate/arsenite/antimonite-responsive transcriptional repressor
MARENFRNAVQRDDDALDRYAAIFGALSEPTRLDILLRIAGREELGCAILDDTLPISKSTISYHIKILYQAGLVEVRKDGRHYFYRARHDLLEAAAPGLLKRLLTAHAPKRPSRARNPKKMLAAV